MKIKVTDLDGADHELDALPGWRVMEIIRDWDLPIKAECGGACACATCHSYIDEAWLDKLPPMDDMEDSMLEAAYERKPNSRLTCQIEMNDELDGLIVHGAENEG
jgi:2Fe-2S ferredoxin